jgi:S-adenosylmethionine:tRNA ribosyltransferase-isomerase
VIAVGSTVVRALESAADPGGGGPGVVRATAGWTDLVVGTDHVVSTVDGLLTGWHEPAATHQAMLRAVAGTDLVRASYAAALAAGYRWHEFGDLHLLLPARG